MNQDFFDTQLARLQDQWPNAYSDERKAILFRAFRTVPDEDFREAVTDCLATMRSFPLLPELSQACADARARSFESLRYDGMRAARGTVAGVLQDAAERGEQAKDFSKACMEFLVKKVARKLAPADWEQACELLDTTAAQLTGLCRRCVDGFVFSTDSEGYRSLYRCTCSLGRALPPEVYGGVRKDGERVKATIPLAQF